MTAFAAFSAPGRFLKGNIHTHTNRSDGRLPPREVVERYRAAGYDFLAITDHFLASAIDWLKAHQAQWAPVLEYVSDHGESLGENNLYLHGLPYRFAPDVQKHVPWIFWLSPTFEQQSGVKLDFLARQQGEKLSHDHYFHSTLGLLGVQTQVHDPARDVFTSCRAGAA